MDMTRPSTSALPKRKAPLPGFRQPDQPSQPDPTPSPLDTSIPPALPERPQSAPWAHAESAVQRDVPMPKLGPPATLTATSATSDAPDPKILAGAAAALLGLVVTVAAVLVTRARPSRKLRRPQDKHIKQFGDAAASILARHLEIAKIHPSLLDATKAVGAAGAWIEEGPLTIPARLNAGQLPQGDDDDEGDGY